MRGYKIEICERKIEKIKLKQFPEIKNENKEM